MPVVKDASASQGSTLGKIFRLLEGINIHPAYLGIPVALSLAAAAFEGVSLGLLVPILNGFLQQDYSFITQVPGLRWGLSLLPASLTGTDRTLFATLMGFFLISVLLKNALKYASGVSMGYFTSRALHHLRKVVFGRFLSFGKLYFDRTSVGHNATVLSQFTENVLMPLHTINTFVNSIFSLVVYLFVMSRISWQLTVFAFPLFGFLFFIVRKAIKEIRHISQSMAGRSGDMGKIAIEILSTMPLVKSYSSENREQKRYADVSDMQAKLNFRSVQLKELILPMQETITLVCSIILFAGMLYLLVQQGGDADPTSFIVYFYVVLNASTKFGILTGFRGVLANAAGPADELLKIFDDGDKSFVPDGTKAFPGLKDRIEFKNLTFGYPGREGVLKNVSLSIPKGDMVAIVGATGSGKTTLIHLITRLYDCPPGTLFIDGTDIRDWTLASLHEHTAIVSQETLLIHDTLRNNIAYGLNGVTDERIREVVTQARLDDFVSKLPQGLETLVGDRGVKLSGGEKQRVSIARALLKGAEILILDEATSALDSQTEKLIQEAIDDAVRGRTAIVIAHRLSTIQHANKIVVLDEGKLAEEGKLQELLDKKGRFHRLWEDQKFV